jgi:hypothetical protein
MDDNTLSSLITASALVVFLVSGWATFWIYRARRGGWNRLAAAYGTQPRKDAMPRRWQSITLMPARVRYRWIISLRLTVDGLYIRPLFPFSFGHDPILVPWDDIEIFAIETYPADRLYDLKFALEPQIKLRVGVAVAQFIRRAADNVHYFVEPQVDVKTVAARTAQSPAA